MEYGKRAECLVKHQDGWFQVAIKQTVLEEDGRMPSMTWDVYGAASKSEFEALKIAANEYADTEFYEPIVERLKSLI